MILGLPRIHVTECESTQLLLDPSLPEGAVATAEHQTGGRGRLGRAWDDVAGTALLCSVLLKPPTVRRAAELTLVGGLAVAETVEHALGRTAELKWPNDVLVAGEKVAGGLAEVRDGAVVLGLGVNVNQTRAQLPPDARIPAASLRTVDGQEREVEALLTGLLRALDEVYATWRVGGLRALHAHISERDFLRGRRIAVDGIEGIAHGIRPDGRLEMSTSRGAILVESGEVQFF
jgi:BirA family transcriptional regulator, biotin operon repressor / biotin---[acetyl-CoA-carboxylase] ligase